MRFAETTAEELEQIHALYLDGKGKKEAVQAWESFYVVKTQHDITMSTPSHVDSLGIYFQPRIGTGSGVITLDEAVELHRVIDNG